ncbi:hypothetical protein B6K69_01625 [Fuscovulum blasticum]|nr:hypothetical protein B6K69_01625 [Fuscovulum blasticum]
MVHQITAKNPRRPCRSTKVFCGKIIPVAADPQQAIRAVEHIKYLLKLDDSGHPRTKPGMAGLFSEKG